MFDRIARVYDRMNSVMTAGHAPPLARARGGPGARWARASGRSTWPPAPATWRSSCASRGAEVVGLDFSEEMLSWRARRSPAIDFGPGNALALPFADDEFDAVTVGFGARNFDDLDARSGRDGARGAPGRPRGGARDHDARSSRRCRWFFALWFDRLVPALGRLAGDPDAYSYLPERAPLPRPRGAGRADGRAPA